MNQKFNTPLEEAEYIINKLNSSQALTEDDCQRITLLSKEFQKWYPGLPIILFEKEK